MMMMMMMMIIIIIIIVIIIIIIIIIVIFIVIVVINMVLYKQQLNFVTWPFITEPQTSKDSTTLFSLRRAISDPKHPGFSEVTLTHIHPYSIKKRHMASKTTSKLPQGSRPQISGLVHFGFQAWIFLVVSTLSKPVSKSCRSGHQGSCFVFSQNRDGIYIKHHQTKSNSLDLIKDDMYQLLFTTRSFQEVQIDSCDFWFYWDW